MQVKFRVVNTCIMYTYGIILNNCLKFNIFIIVSHTTRHVSGSRLQNYT